MEKPDVFINTDFDSKITAKSNAAGPARMDYWATVAKAGNIINIKYLLPFLLVLFIVLLLGDNSRPNEELSSVFGFLSGLLFIVANAYYPARIIARQFKPLPISVIVFFKKYLEMHVWMNEVAFFAMVVHCHYSDEGNIFLTGLYVVTVFLTIEGIVMHYRLIPSEQKLLRMLHAQQVLFVAWVLLIIVGHSID